MGKFDGILLCVDLDDTLLCTDKSVSERNINAIEYFKAEGGLFTFVTGRVPLGTLPVLDYITPNAPAVCMGGGAIYDFNKKETLWSSTLDGGAAEAVEYIDKHFPAAGIEICCADTVYFSKVNEYTERHKMLERFPDNYEDYHNIRKAWCKVIFMVAEAEMEALKRVVLDSPFNGKYAFIRTSPWYYELMPKGIDKGHGIETLAGMLQIKKSHIVAVGDNENDIDMIKAAGVGAAVANAVDAAREAADYITSDNNSDAIAAVIADIESGKIKLG